MIVRRVDEQEVLMQRVSCRSFGHAPLHGSDDRYPWAESFRPAMLLQPVRGSVAPSLPRAERIILDV